MTLGRAQGLRRLGLLDVVLLVAIAVTGAYFLVANLRTVPQDFASIWHGVHTFSSGSSPYVRHPGVTDFVFAPSAAILLWPEALSLSVSSRLVALLNLALIAWLALGAWSACRTEDHAAPRRWCWAMLAVALFDGARTGRGNEDIIAASLVLAAMVIASGRLTGVLGHTALAGVALGLAISFKLTALPAILVLVLLEEWVATLLALALPILLSGVAILRVRQMTRWLDWTLPYLRHRLPPSRSLDVSFQALFSKASSTRDLLWLVLGLVATALVAWFCGLWRSGRPRIASQLILVSGLFELIFFVASPGSFPYYWVYGLPALVVVGRDRVAAVLALLGMVALTVPQAIVDHVAKVPGLRSLTNERSLVAYLLLIAAFGIALGRRPRSTSPQPGHAAGMGTVSG